jgi:uncharacterized membrane protein
MPVKRRDIVKCTKIVGLVLAVGLAATAEIQAAQQPLRVLFVGGDWKAQLPNYQGTTPLRGHFIRREVDKAAPGRFAFTLWTSYELLQYGDAEALKPFDVIVVGDTMGQSVMPRLVRGLTTFVEGGGGFLYCDNHKAFSFNTRELSFDEVLPIEVVPFRPYDEGSQPVCSEKPLAVRPAAPQHPVMRGLDWGSAPPLQAARYGKLKPGAAVLARSPGGKEIWVAWEKGRGRAIWLGGVLANDELSEDFAKWPAFGKFYSQLLAWLGEKSTYARPGLRDATAGGSLQVDPAQPGPPVIAAHFGIHGQESSGSGDAMQGADLALYQALNLEGTFARTGIASPGDYVAKGKGGQFDFVDDGADLTRFDAAKYDFKRCDAVLDDCRRIAARPITLAWCPWFGPHWPEPKRYTKYFAAFLEHAGGRPGAQQYGPRVDYFEIMNEPNLYPAAEALPRYTDFFNYSSAALRQRFPTVKFGCGGFFEWSYLQRVIDRCGRNLDWISRHPYGHTGEAVFYLQDQYAAHAKSKGLAKLKFIITEWDFWIYGPPAFDYIMMRWKPLIEHADSCLGTLHYRWREYAEGGYVFGLHGEFDQRYGELPPEWPNPGKNKPITYRYNAFWLMRNCRGPQLPVQLDIPELAGAESTHAYAVATCDGKRFNVVIYHGYPYQDLKLGKTYNRLKVRIQTPIPAQVKGRQLTVARADCRQTHEAPARTIAGNTLDLELEIPSLSGVSLTVQ